MDSTHHNPTTIWCSARHRKIKIRKVRTANRHPGFSVRVFQAILTLCTQVWTEYLKPHFCAVAFKATNAEKR